MAALGALLGAQEGGHFHAEQRLAMAKHVAKMVERGLLPESAIAAIEGATSTAPHRSGLPTVTRSRPQGEYVYNHVKSLFPSAQRGRPACIPARSCAPPVEPPLVLPLHWRLQRLRVPASSIVACFNWLFKLAMARPLAGRVPCCCCAAQCTTRPAYSPDVPLCCVSCSAEAFDGVAVHAGHRAGQHGSRQVRLK